MCIPHWCSEPHTQWQNPAERRIQYIKQVANTVMDMTGAPPEAWLLCLMCVCFVINHLWDPSLGNVPLTALTGVSVDISVILRFSFWEKVCFAAIEPGFPSDSKEIVGCIVGFSEHVGNAMCCKICNPATGAISHRSRCRPIPPDDPNHRAERVPGETSTSSVPRAIIRSSKDPIGTESESNPLDTENGETEDGETDQDVPKPKLIIAGPEDLVGKSFLMDAEEDGQRFRARVVKCLDDLDNRLDNDKERIKCLCKLNDDEREELFTCSQIVDFLNRDAEQDVLWRHKRIVSHQGPLRPGHKDCMGSKHNIMLEWEDGQATQEPLNLIAKEDPVAAPLRFRAV